MKVPTCLCPFEQEELTTKKLKLSLLGGDSVPKINSVYLTVLLLFEKKK